MPLTLVHCTTEKPLMVIDSNIAVERFSPMNKEQTAFQIFGLDSTSLPAVAAAPRQKCKSWLTHRKYFCHSAAVNFHQQGGRPAAEKDRPPFREMTVGDGSVQYDGRATMIVAGPARLR